MSCLLFLTTAIYAEPPAERQRGTQGLVPFAVSVRNTGSRPLDCEATTAHWYSVALGTVAGGADLSTTLWKNAASGEVFILNRRRDRMPVQRFWCGEEGKSWSTRSDISMPTRRDSRPSPIALTCAGGAQGVVCQPAPAPR
ncbi:hypothetical protein ACL2XP_06075 [Sodalis sp. RH21]|uniref:hypothetical protein n=1 Tax=unclassified Sodalis (in: enterobacteria) TaxID=2636512 RepID=UPI0039B4F6F9